jgi:hypothetical protein
MPEAIDVLVADAVEGGTNHRSWAGSSLPQPPTHGPSRDTPAGTLARRVTKLRRYAPSAMFDKQIRKTNQLGG